MPNLVIAGSGLFPTCGGVNPTFTIYGDVKNVTRSVREELGAGCITIEDQVSPKRCYGVTKKSVIVAVLKQYISE